MKNLIDSYYDFNITRTGLYKESDSYSDKAKVVKNIEKICLQKNINFLFDMSINRGYTNKFEISCTGCNYGIILNYVNNRFEQYIFEKHILNKDLKNILNIDLTKELFISKYNQETSHIYEKKINGVAVLPNQNKLKNIDFIKVDEFMKDKENYIKIHPVISKEFTQHLALKYGKERMIPKFFDLTDIIKKSNIVAVTSNTESMIPVSLYNKKYFLLSTDNLNSKNSSSTYPLFYFALKYKIPIQKIFNADLTSLIPWSLVNDEKYIVNKIDKMMGFYVEWRNTVYNCSF